MVKAELKFLVRELFADRKKEAEAVTFFLLEHPDTDEFVVAAQTGLSKDAVREMLYRLQTENIVTYFKRKDKEAGWYMSFWQVNRAGVLYLTKKRNANRLISLEKRLQRELSHDFFVCPALCIRFEEKDALEHDYRCPDCGAVLVPHNNERLVAEIRRRISEEKTALKTGFW